MLGMIQNGWNYENSYSKSANVHHKSYHSCYKFYDSHCKFYELHSKFYDLHPKFYNLTTKKRNWMVNSEMGDIKFEDINIKYIYIFKYIKI